MKSSKLKNNLQETPVKIESQGCLLINRAYIMARGKNVVAINVDMCSKRGIVSGIFGDGEDNYSLIIDKAEDTVNHDTNTNNPTILNFPKFKGWSIWSAQISKCTLAVCLINK